MVNRSLLLLFVVNVAIAVALVADSAAADEAFPTGRPFVVGSAGGAPLPSDNVTGSGANNRVAVFTGTNTIAGQVHLTYPTNETLPHALAIDGSDDLGATLTITGAGHGGVGVKVYEAPAFGASGGFLSFADSAGNLCSTGRVSVDQGDTCLVAQRGVVGGSLWLLSFDGYGIKIDRSRGDALVTDLSQDFIERAVSDGPITVLAGRSVVYADSTAHVLELSNNGDAFAQVGRIATRMTSADFPKTTAVFSTVTGMGATLSAGSWSCDVNAVVGDTTAADGVGFDLSFSGTATTQNASITIVCDNTTLAGAESSTSVSTAGATAAICSQGHVAAHASLVVTASGALNASFRQAAHSTGTATLFAGATNVCHRI
jgi:hypothetical protein